MTQQARPVLDLALQATGAIAYGRAVALSVATVFGAIGGVQATVAGQKLIGVARRDAALGAFVDCTVLGTAVCETGAAITLGSRVQCDASGRVITAVALSATLGTLTGGIGTLQVGAGATAVTSSAASGAILTGAGTVTGAPALAGGDPPVFVWGTALQSCAGAGEFIEVLICP